MFFLWVQLFTNRKNLWDPHCLEKQINTRMKEYFPRKFRGVLKNDFFFTTGFKRVLFSPLPGEKIQFGQYFSRGLKPPTRQQKSSPFFGELKAVWREDPLTPRGDIEGCTGASVVGEEYISHQTGKKSRFTPPPNSPPPKKKQQIHGTHQSHEKVDINNSDSIFLCLSFFVKKKRQLLQLVGPPSTSYKYAVIISLHLVRGELSPPGKVPFIYLRRSPCFAPGEVVNSADAQIDRNGGSG